MVKYSFKSRVDDKEISYFVAKANETKAILSFVHGSIEYAKRYEQMVKSLNKLGITVYLLEVRGHGNTAKNNNNFFGHFSSINGSKKVLDDLNQLNEIIKKKFPKKKIALAGHSMGSFIVRAYVLEYHDVDMLIPIGTNHKPKMLLNLLNYVARRKCYRNAEKPGDFLSDLSYKSFNKKFKKEGNLAWLSKNKENVVNYKKSPLTKFKMTNKAFLDMGIWMKSFVTKKEVLKMSKIPILFLYGSHDPVGNFGKEPHKACKFYNKLGFDAKEIRYEDMRHEIHNESNSEIVIKDLSKFILNNAK